MKMVINLRESWIVCINNIRRSVKIVILKYE